MKVYTRVDILCPSCGFQMRNSYCLDDDKHVLTKNYGKENEEKIVRTKPFIMCDNIHCGQDGILYECSSFELKRLEAE